MREFGVEDCCLEGVEAVVVAFGDMFVFGGAAMVEE